MNPSQTISSRFTFPVRYLISISVILSLISCKGLEVSEPGGSTSSENLKISALDVQYTKKFQPKKSGRYIIAVIFDTSINPEYFTCAYGRQERDICKAGWPRVKASYEITSKKSGLLSSENKVYLKPVIIAQGYSGVELDFFEPIEKDDLLTIKISLQSSDEKVLEANPRLVVRDPLW